MIVEKYFNDKLKAMKKIKDIIPIGTETRFINCLRRYYRDYLLINLSSNEAYNLNVGGLNDINAVNFRSVDGVGKNTFDQLEDLKAKLQRFDKRNYHRLHNKNK